MRKKRLGGFPTRANTNWAVQPQKMAIGWKFQILEIEIVLNILSKQRH